MALFPVASKSNPSWPQAAILDNFDLLLHIRNGSFDPLTQRVSRGHLCDSTAFLFLVIRSSRAEALSVKTHRQLGQFLNQAYSACILFSIIIRVWSSRNIHSVAALRRCVLLQSRIPSTPQSTVDRIGLYCIHSQKLTSVCPLTVDGTILLKYADWYT